MTYRANGFLTTLLCLVGSLIGSSLSWADGKDGPSYEGTPLSVWADEVLSLNQLSNVNSSYPQVRAIRAIGTNAIPWLLTELAKGPETDPISKGQFDLLALPVGSEPIYHQLRARACFWALGEQGAPAIPALELLLDQQPEFVPSALAGIGAPALGVLAQCITNITPHAGSAGPRDRAMVSALGGLAVALNLGRIPRTAAANLLPDVRRWAAQENDRAAAYYAKGVIRILDSRQ